MYDDIVTCHEIDFQISAFPIINAAATCVKLPRLLNGFPRDFTCHGGRRGLSVHKPWQLRHHFVDNMHPATWMRVEVVQVKNSEDEIEEDQTRCSSFVPSIIAWPAV